MRTISVISVAMACLLTASASAQYPGEAGADVPVVDHPSECAPACRSGYVCLEGTCVSACNPPCGAGETCTDAGECVAPPSSQPSPGQVSQPPPGQVSQPPPGQVSQPPPGVAAPVARPSAGTARANAQASERQRLRERRARLRLGMFFEAGYGGVDAEDYDTVAVYYLGPRFGLGFELRKNFAYRVGVRFRVGVESSVGTDDDAYVEGGDFGSSTAEYRGWETRFYVSPNLRFGPFAQGFPLYFDIGAHVGTRLFGASPTGSGEEGGSLPTRFEAQFSAGPEVGFGFVFGEERFDLAFRGRSGFAGPDFQFWASVVSLGISFT